MIILITGASHTGKTCLSQKMLEKYKYPYLSIDHLKMGLIRSGNTDFSVYDDERLTIYLWPIVREIIKTAIENKQNLIIEGAYVPFDFRQDFDDKYINEIRFICLAMTDRYIDTKIDDILNHSSDIEKRLCEDSRIDDLKNDNHRMINGFTNAGEQIVIIDNEYDKTIESIVNSCFKN